MARDGDDRSSSMSSSRTTPAARNGILRIRTTLSRTATLYSPRSCLRVASSPINSVSRAFLGLRLAAVSPVRKHARPDLVERRSRPEQGRSRALAPSRIAAAPLSEKVAGSNSAKAILMPVHGRSGALSRSPAEPRRSRAALLVSERSPADRAERLATPVQGRSGAPAAFGGGCADWQRADRREAHARRFAAYARGMTCPAGALSSNAE
jgi:hypothetical protein